MLTDASRKQFAVTLKVSLSAVDFHSKNLYRKLGIKSRVELLTKYGKK
jgi:DNA-binding CsgD family transcriptional regulator